MGFCLCGSGFLVGIQRFPVIYSSYQGLGCIFSGILRPFMFNETILRVEGFVLGRVGAIMFFVFSLKIIERKRGVELLSLTSMGRTRLEKSRVWDNVVPAVMRWRWRQ